MLTIQHICKSFGQKKVINNVSIAIHKGDFIIMVGANGSGKSTLLHLIAGALTPDSGTITLGNTDITHMNTQARAQWISQLLQNPKDNTIASMTVAENFALAAMRGHPLSLRSGQQACNPKTIEQIQQEYAIDLQPFLHKTMGELSGGQRQLLAFIMATMHKPQLLLLDEPTAALDPQAATTLLSSAHRFIHNHHMTAILVTHDPQLALTLGNKIWVLKDNQLHIFDEKQKKDLSSQDLIGHIDYERITA